MDTLTHALSGALLGRALAGGRAAPGLSVRQAVLAGAAAAAFPDSDFVLSFVSELSYLRGHRGITHSLLMLPLWAALLAVLFGWLARRSSTAPGWRNFYAIACAGLAIHIAGDLITQFGTMIFAPLSDFRFGLGTTFIIDLGLSGLITAGLITSAIWRRSRLPATLALIAVIGWIGISATGRSEALEVGREYARSQGISPTQIDAIPRPASPFNWTVVVFDGERYHTADINTRRSEPLTVQTDDNPIRQYSAHYLPIGQAVWQTRPRFGAAPGDDPALAQAVWHSADFAFFRWFAMFPALDRVQQLPDGRRCVSFTDLRFETPGRAETPFRYGLCQGTNPDGWQLFRRLNDGLRWLDAR